ncbi:MAG TPA: substrate-binding domain-containing protein [Terriglobales bacterium]|nr:substrate-binding domain-containing protein [Terriglobales bacterium]
MLLNGGTVRAGWMVVFLMIWLGWTAPAAAKDIALVSNKANHVETVTLPDLVKICKGQSNHWSDGKPVTLVMRDPASPEMKLVLQKIYEMPKEDVAALIASANHNRQNHPAIVVADSDEAVVKKVESTPGSVGLVDVYAITGSVTVVRVGSKLPLEPGYVLHGN